MKHKVRVTAEWFVFVDVIDQYDDLDEVADMALDAVKAGTMDAEWISEVIEVVEDYEDLTPLINNPDGKDVKQFDEMTDYVKKQYADGNKGMMQHVELKYYWLYEYVDADGAVFKSTLKLSDEQMDQNDLTLNKEIRIHYTGEIVK